MHTRRYATGPLICALVIAVAFIGPIVAVCVLNATLITFVFSRHAVEFD